MFRELLCFPQKPVSVWLLMRSANTRQNGPILCLLLWYLVTTSNCLGLERVCRTQLGICLLLPAKWIFPCPGKSVSPWFPVELLCLVLSPNLHSVIERGCTWVVRSKKLTQNHSAYPLLDCLNPLFLEEKQLFRVMREFCFDWRMYNNLPWICSAALYQTHLFSLYLFIVKA